MNERAKKRIVIFSSDILAALSAIIALACIYIKIKDIPRFNFEGLNLIAVKSIFPRGNTSLLHLPLNNFTDNPAKNNINNLNGNTNKMQTPSVKPLEKPSNIDMPDLENPQSNSKPASPNEKTYKIIESQFGSSGLKHENFYIKNMTGQNIDIATELNKRPEITMKNTDKPQVLIFHTHTSESYMSQDQGFFYESFYPRSTDDSQNVIRVGKAITDKLKEHGIGVIHETAYHDLPSYSGSYARAAQCVKNWIKDQPSIQVVIDIHRDSLGDKETGKIKPTFKYKDKKAAQLMIISGCDPDNSLGFPNWEKNLRLALRLQKCCETLFPGITRPLNFSKVKYNQHLTPGSLLVEIGSDVNTLEEAVYTGTMLGESVAKLLNELKN